MLTLYTLLLVVGLVSALVTPNSALSRRAKDSVPTHLGKPNTFYHAAVAGELDYSSSNYKKGSSPTGHGNRSGDFTVDGTGGLYVFDSLSEAECYGKSRSFKSNTYDLITLQYTPSSSLSTKSFTKDDSTWLAFVKSCHANTAHTYKIVEGPYSHGNVGAMSPGGNGMLWQAAFIGQDALKTLKVTDVRKVNTAGGPASCSVM